MYSADGGEGRVGLAVYPWEISLARAESLDSAVNHVHGEVSSVVVARQPRPRSRRPADGRDHHGLGGASGAARGGPVVASFKATASRLVPLG